MIFTLCTYILATFVGDIDYDPGPYNVIIPAGATSVLFNVSVTTDSIVELDEEFELTIDEASLPDVVSSAESTTVIIVDNDSKLLRNLCQM